MAIKVQGTTVIDDSRDISNIGIATVGILSVGSYIYDANGVFGTTNQVLTSVPGIGVSWADESGGGSGGDKIEEGNTSAEVVDTGSNGHFKVTTEGIERLRIDSSGDVGIGTDNPSYKLHIRAANASGIFIDDSNLSTDAPHIRVRGKRSDSNFSQAFSGQLILEKNQTDGPTINGRHLGAIIFGGNYDASPGVTTGMTYGASIGAMSEGEFSDINTAPTALVFRTGTVGIGTLGEANINYGDTESLRINSNNNVLIGSASDTGTSNQKLQVNSGAYVSGSVGIGVTLPVGLTPGSTQTLHLNGTSAALRVGPYYTSGVDRDNILLVANSTDSYIRSNNERFHFYNGSGDILFHTASDAERVRITSDGNLGIGITNPDGKLDVLFDTSAGNRHFFTKDGLGVRLQRRGDTVAWAMEYGFETNNGTDVGGFGAYGTNTGLNRYYIGSSYQDTKFVIESGGDVGIGTDNPQNKLDVRGDIRIQDSIPTILFRSPDGSSNQYYIGANISDSVNGGLIIGEGSGITGGTGRININSSGDVGIGTNNPQQKLQVDGNIRVQAAAGNINNNYSIIYQNSSSSADYGLTLSHYQGDTNNTDARVVIGGDGGSLENTIRFYRDVSGTNTETARFDENGRLGINSTAPTAKLDVNGDVSIASTVSIGTTIDIVPYNDLGALSFEGSAGQLFSITNNLTSGSIFSVNDVSGIPSIDVDADGTVLIAPYGSTEYVGIGTTNPTAKLDVNGTLNVTGVSTFQVDVYLGDNDKIVLGDGGDLEIYHTGTNSFISDAGTGNLGLLGNNEVWIGNTAASEYKARFITDGAVELYYDNSKKFETVGTGVSVFGNLYFNGTNYLSEVSSPGEFGSVQINGSGLNTWEGYSIDGRAAFIHDGNSATGLYNDVNNEWLLRAEFNGEVALYHDGSKKFETASYGIYVTGVGNTSTIGGAANLVLDPSTVGDNTGTVTILGNLQVEGTQTIINSTTLEVDDKLVSIAKSATNATQADGAGLEINGASATLTYSFTDDSWVFNKAPYYNTNRILTTADEGTGNGLDADTLDGSQKNTLVASLRANHNITGGGTITFNSSGYLKNSDRFIVISNGRGSHFSTIGYFDINIPTSGTITGVGGALNKTATSDGIPLGTWEALYYILPIGSSNTSVAANFRVCYFTSDVEIPETWVLVAIRNGDTNQKCWVMGKYGLEPGESIDTTTYDAKNADLLDGLEASQFLRSDADTQTTGQLTADTLLLTNDATNTSRHRVSVFDTGTTSYGMMLWNTNGTSGDWATMIYGPNQSDRRISFGKITGGSFVSHSDVTEFAHFDTDDYSLNITGQLISTKANSTSTGGGQLYLNGATGNRIDFNTSGIAAPSFTTRSSGTKIVLYPNLSASTGDYALGIQNNTLWYSVSLTNDQHRWYAGTTQLADLKGTGELVIGSTSLTGTSSQRLQVTGGAYVSGNLGVGVTNPGSTLAVGGTITELYNGTYWNVVTQADVGYGASQVPLNQYLGQLAFLDDYHPNGLRRDGGGSDDVFVSSGGEVLVGSSSTTGTSNQKLQVTGGAYFSQAVGIGYTAPGFTLAVNGSGYFNTNLIGTNVLAGTQTLTGTANQKLQVDGGAYVSGNLGIGVTNPTSRLELYESTGTDLRLNTAVDNDNSITFAENGINYFRILHDGSGLSSPNNVFKIQTATASGGINNDAITIKQSGDVGIGTNNPLDPLHVLGPDGSSGSPSLSSNNVALFQNDGSAGDGAVISVVAGNTGTAQISLGDVTNANIGAVRYNNSTNSLDFVTNGTGDRVVIDSAGNLGIGKTNPLSNLHISGTSSSPCLVFPDTTNPRYSVGFGNVNVSGVGQRLDFFAGDSGSNTSNLSSSHLRMSLTATGNLGIGTDNPGEKLDVRGHIKVDNGPTLEDGGNTQLQITTAYGHVKVGPRNTSWSHFYTDRNQYYFDKRIAVDTGQISSYDDDLAFFTDEFNTERLRILASNGYVGINTTSPSYQLHVNGSFAATTKSFVIDHPTKEGMKLRYGSLEGPENGVYVRGRLKDNNTIELPDHWTGLVDEETITVNLTPIGRKAPLHSVVDIVDNTVVVESANDVVDCFYTVFGERKDVEKLEVEF